ATTEEITRVEVVRRPALGATASDDLEADGYLTGTPANRAYISGALKHFFAPVYYPCLSATARPPFGYYGHGNQGVEGAHRAIKSITTGLGWKQAAEPLTVLGQPDQQALEACWELGATIAANLMQ